MVSKKTKRRLRMLAAAAVATPALALCVSSQASAELADEQNTGVVRINQARAAAGLCPVVGDRALTVFSQDWSNNMASTGVLRHGSIAASNANAENVGYGTDAASVQSAFMNSAPHRANILNGGFTSVGVGVAHSGSRTWTTYRFAGSGNTC